MTPIDRIPLFQSRFSRYLLAVLAAALSTLARWLFPEVLSATPYLAFYPAVVVAALLGGLGPGLFCTVLSLVVVAGYFGPFITAPGGVWRQIIWVAGNVGVCLLARMMRRARHEAEAKAAAAQAAEQALREDIVKRQAAEQALRQSEERFRSFFHNNAAGAVEVDLEGRYLDVNARYCQITGYTREELLQTSPLQLTHPEDRPREQEVFARYLRGEADHFEIEKRYMRKDHSIIWVQVTAVLVRNAAGKPLRSAGLVQDITARKLAEEALNRRAEELQRLLDVVPAAVFVSHDPECRFVSTNERAKEFYEAQDEENCSATAHPGIRRFFSMEGRELAPEELPMQRAVASGQPVRDAELSVTLPSGRSIAILGSAEPLLDEQGHVRGCVGAFMDITRRRKIEQDLIESEQQLRQAHEELRHHAEDLEKTVTARTAKLVEVVAELEHFSYAIVHDLRAPLRGMQGFSQMLEEECAGCPFQQRKEYFKRINVAATRMDQLITDSLNYSKAVRQEVRLEPVDLFRLLDGMVSTYPNLQPDNAEIQLARDLPKVIGNEAALTQCFGNLLGNAVKFAKPNTRPTIRVRAEERELNTVRIWVEDDGMGIPADMLPRLFGMFQRGSTDREGTGIGLAIVRKVVLRMGGQVGVESTPGQGSRFWVELPKSSLERK